MPDRQLVVLSDIEMGAGGPTDDFPHDAWLAELLEARASRRDGPVDLVFNGDTFDFLKTSVDGVWPRHVDARVALAKLDRIARAHPLFFEAVGDFLRSGRERRVVFVLGNHDGELLFPEVKGALRQRLGAQDRVQFPGAAFRVADVHVEHGQQADVMFAFDLDQPFVSHQGRDLLNLAWASVALLDVAMPLQPLLYHFDRLKPRERVFELMPEVKELIVGTFWRYWTRDYLRDLWQGRDPLKRMTWTMFKEIVYRLGTQDTNVTIASQWKAALQRSDEVRLVVLGHEHKPAWWTWGDRKILRAGCLREEYMLSPDGLVATSLPKAWVEASLRDGRVRTSQLCEEVGPPVPPGYAPDTVFDVLPVVRRLLGTIEERAMGAAAQAEQEAAEAHLLREDEEVSQHAARSLELTEELEPVPVDDDE